MIALLLSFRATEQGLQDIETVGLHTFGTKKAKRLERSAMLI
jgi:hypothetical protein